MGGIHAKSVSDAEILRFFTIPQNDFIHPKPGPSKPKNAAWAFDQFRSLTGLVHSKTKTIYKGQKAVQWLDSQKSAIRSDIDANPSAKILKGAYEDGIQLVKGKADSPFAYWLSHRILSDPALDPTQKINYLEKLIAQKSVSLDQVLATAPKQTCGAIIKLLGHEKSPNLAELIGRNASAPMSAKILDIMAKGLVPEKRAGAMQALLGEVKSAKGFSALVSELSEAAWKQLMITAKDDKDLQKRLTTELSPLETSRRFLSDGDFRKLQLNQIKTQADFVKFVDHLAKADGMGAGSLGFFINQALHHVDPMLFHSAVNHLFSKGHLINALGNGILGDTAMQKKLFAMLNSKECKQLASVLLSLEDHQPSVFDFMTNSPQLLTHENFTAYGLKVTQQSRLAMEALEQLALSLGGDKFHQLFGSFKDKSYQQQRWASVIARSPQLQKMVGQLGTAQETGAVLDAMLHLKMKKHEIGTALREILKNSATKKKNAVLFSSSARLAGFLETQLHMGARDFEKGILFQAMSARGAFEIRKALVFLALTAKNNPEVINPNHVGVVINQSRSISKSQSLSTKVGAEVGTDGLLVNAKISAEVGREWNKQKGKSSGKTVDLDRKEQHHRNQKRFQKIWKVILPLDNSVAAFLRLRSEKDPAFAKAYHQLLDMQKKDQLRKAFDK